MSLVGNILPGLRGAFSNLFNPITKWITKKLFGVEATASTMNNIERNITGELPFSSKAGNYFMP